MQHDLVRRAMAGDHAAFTTLAATALARLHRTARLILGDEERAADAVQDALVAAWTDLRAVRDPERFDAWLMRVLVHACYAEARRHRRRAVTELRVDPFDRRGVPDVAHDLALRDELARAFARIPPEQRAALVAHHYLGLGDVEAAAVLGIPVGTYKSRLHRATAAMRGALEAEARLDTHAAESFG
jgi:RNA polymerase sigma-70 factor, ECF subfamily